MSKFKIGDKVKIKTGKMETILEVVPMPPDWGYPPTPDVFFGKNVYNGRTFVGEYFEESFELVSVIDEVVEDKSKEYNSTCPRCNSPAYLGFFSIECSKECS